MQKILHMRKGRISAKAVKKNNKKYTTTEQKKKMCVSFLCYRIALPDDENKREQVRKSTILQYGSLFQGYEDDAWYWEIFEMCRKYKLYRKRHNHLKCFYSYIIHSA